LKRLILIAIIYFIAYDAFSVCGNTEICINNYSSDKLKIYVYPVSMVFNGYYMYNFVAEGRTTSYNFIDYICGVHCGEFYIKKTYNELAKFNVIPLFCGGDYEARHYGNSSADYQLGFGTYKIQILRYDDNDILTGEDSCLVEFDYFDLSERVDGDLAFFVYDRGNEPYFTYHFDRPYYRIVPITYDSPENYKVEIWRPEGPGYNPVRPKRFGPSNNGDGFYSFKEESNPIYNLYKRILPLDCRMDCNLELNIPPLLKNQNHVFPRNYTDGELELRQGELYNNLYVQKRVFSPIDIWNINTVNDWNMPLRVNAGAKLKLAPQLSFNFSMIYNGIDHPEFNFIVNANATLILEGLDTVFTKKGAITTFEPYSYLTLGNNCMFIVEKGGVFCNKGAIVSGILRVRYLGGVHQIHCSNILPDIFINDSTKIELKDSATIVIPDNKTVYFENPETSFFADSTCTVRVGENSKIVFRNGANINAYKTKFISNNQGVQWDGIYIEDISENSFNNCIIENASNGININNNISTGGGLIEPASLISNCTFVNSTATQLKNAVYLTNSKNVKLQGNTLQSIYISNAFLFGFMLEYCQSGYFNIIDNTISSSETGLIIVQSSPYVARNIITGQSGASFGIFLDNANGTIKNNIVTNFGTSFCSYYSSPYLFRNTFNNTSNIGLDLHSNSVPVMSYIVSGSNINWLGGNNTISGTLSDCGIKMNDESYPNLDDGYNIINAYGTDYINGVMPKVLENYLNSTMNFWGDAQPDPLKFNITDGEVIYEPLYDGVTPISSDNYSVYDLGQGVSDTVLTKELGDTPGSEYLYMEAFNLEMSHSYIQAINLYKQVISDYQNTKYAITSISRIFNCVEKKNGNNGEYADLRNYLSQIKNNQNYQTSLRELAEDFMIKTKVKRGMLTEAITDYTVMYNQNQNTAKGLHALINKECLISLLGDTTDISGKRMYKSGTVHKLNIYSLAVSGKADKFSIDKSGQRTETYTLYQNYPNPFNPATTIKYGMPKDGFISIKVYDITGREIAVLATGYKKAGVHTAVFNGNSFSSGVYFYKMMTDGNSLVKRMILIK
jgi:hypothetical protein